MYKCLFTAGKLSGRFPPDVKTYLGEKGIELVENPFGNAISAEQLISVIANYDAVIAGGEPYNKSTLKFASKLKIIARVGVGYDRVDLEEATRRGIFVTLTPISEIASAEAEHTFALILSFVKKIPYMNSEVRRGIWEPEKWGGLIGDLYGMTLGIVGLGRIGGEVARRAKAFGMKTFYYDVERKPELEGELGIKFSGLDELLSESDIVSLHTPLFPGTHDLINKETIAKMKKGAILINTSRGQIVDSSALYSALKTGQLSGACLDVIDEEPPSSGHVFYELGDELPNLILTQHVGYGPKTGRALVYCAAEDVVRVLRGEPPKYLLNKALLEKRM